MKRLHTPTIRKAAFRAGVPLLTACAAAGGATAVTALTPPTYQATASVVVTSSVPASRDHFAGNEPNNVQSLIPTVLRLAESDTVAGAAAATAHLPLDAVVGHVAASAQPDVQIVTLKAKARVASRAAAIANAMAGALGGQLTRRPLGPDIRLTSQVLDQATVPQRPVEPKPLLNGALGGLLGLFFGLGLVSLRTNRDDRLYSLADTESELGTLILAGVPRLSPWLARYGPRAAYRRSDIGDAVRTAVATLCATFPSAPGRRLLVTSARSDDGKEMLTALLALGLAEQYDHVTLVEGQLHRPAMARHFPETADRTLQSMLGADTVPAPRSLLNTPGLYVVPGKAARPQESAALFRGEGFPRVLKTLAERDSVVVMHAPPVLGSADFAALARHADAVILVTQAGATRAREARRALEVLRLTGTQVAGVVVMNAEDGGHRTGGRPSSRAAAAAAREDTHPRTPALPTAPRLPAVRPAETADSGE